MKKRGLLKKICAVMLALTMVLSSATVTTVLTPQTVEADMGPFASNVYSRLCGQMFNMCSRVVYAGVDKATAGMDPNSPFTKVKNIVFGDQTNQAAELCKEILQEVEDLNENVTDTRDYLSGLITQFSQNVNMQNLSTYTNSMNQITADMQVAWNAYLSYLEKAEIYESNPTQSNLAAAQNAGNLLYGYLEEMDFPGQMTKYIAYVSTKLAYYDENKAQDNPSKTYLYWLYQFCQDEYAFDYQKYDVLSAAISMQAATIQQMMELHAVYIAKLQDDYTDGTITLTDSEISAKVLEYNNCMNMGIYACNNVAEQYAAKMQKMVRSYDLNTTYTMDYRSSANKEANYTITHGVIPNENKSLTYNTKADNTAKEMNFYRVSVDGKTYLFLKQDNREIVASDLIEVFESDNPKALFGALDCRMESMDWFNLLATEDGKYQCITDIDHVYNMISETVYSNSGNNFLTYLQSGGGLQNVANKSNGHTTPYLFIDSSNKAVYNYNAESFDWYPEVYITANWANVAKMSLTSGRFDDSYKVSSDSFNDKKTENVIVMLESVDEAVFEYKVNQQVQGRGTMTVSVDDAAIANGEAAQAGELLAITVMPDQYQTLDSLVISGKSLNKTIAAENDFQYMQKNGDGSATYYFTMPYQDCTITASFVKDTSRNYYSISSKVTGSGTGRYRVVDQDYHAIISLRSDNGNGSAVFGESLRLELSPADNCYVQSVKLTDTDGNLIMKLSTLESTNFVMPEKDCILEIQFGRTTIGGSGTAEDPYTIANFEELSYYATSTWFGSEKTGLDAAHYQNAHYKVIQSINAEATLSIKTAMMGMKLASGGEFNGQGFVISHLRTCNGMFYQNDGTVENVVLEDAYVLPDMLQHMSVYVYGVEFEFTEAAALVYLNNGTIDGCELKNSNLEVSNNTVLTGLGGLVFENTGIIRNSGVDANCTLTANYIGGVAHANNLNNENGGTIQNCYFTGTLKLLTEHGHSAAGITLYPQKGTIDNCYSAGVDINSYSFAVIPTDLIFKNYTVTNCYYDASSETGTAIDGITAWSTSMKSDDFKKQLNANLQDRYQTWTRTTDGSVNGDYPAFEGIQWFFVTENVTGSGSIITSQENGKPVSLGIQNGDKVKLEIVKPEGIALESLKVCKASDISVVYKEFGATTEDTVSFIMPNYDVVIIAEFGNWSTEYTIGSRIDGIGEIIITDKNGTNITSSVINKTINVKAVPGVGYSTSSFELRDEDGNVVKTFSSETDSFVMESKNYVVYASFAEGEVTYNLTASVSGDGSGTATLTNEDGTTVDGGVKPYTDVQLTFTPDEGSYPSMVQIVDNDGKVIETLIGDYKDYLVNKNEDGSYTTGFCMPTRDCEIQVTYSLIPALYNISSEITGSGEVEIEVLSGLLHQSKVTEGTVLKIRALPTDEEGYVVSAAAYDTAGAKLAVLAVDTDYTVAVNETQYTYTIPAQDVVIKVEFYEEEPLPTLYDEDGDGYYEIASYEDLVAMAKLIQAAPETYASAKYKQICNINCMLQPWEQEIGTEAIPFEGEYEGYDYYVLGLRPTSEVSGLFGVIGTNGVVKNSLVVDFDYASSAEMASGFAGINRGTIMNCGSGVNLTSAGTTFLYGNDTPVVISSLDSDILATEMAGGLVAVNEGTILNSRSSANVTIKETSAVESAAGALAAENSGTIKNVFNTGVISGADIAGGIVGKNSGTLQYGYNNTTVTGTTVGSIAGTSDNSNISDFWYVNTMAAACDSLADSTLTNISAMVAADMKTSTFADTLNAAIAGQNLTPWTQAANKNSGYPRLESVIVVQRTLTAGSNEAAAYSLRSAARTIASDDSTNNITVSGRIHPDAKLMLVRLTEGTLEYDSLKGALKEGKFAEGWKMALVYDDGTYAVWEGPLTIKITPEQAEKLKELKAIYCDINGEHKFPNVKIEGDSLIINVDDIGSFALVKVEDIKDDIVDNGKDDNTSGNTGDNNGSGGTNTGNGSGSGGINTGDSAVILPFVLLMCVSAAVVAGLIIKRKRGMRNE